MWTGLTVINGVACLNFSRVVLDFLFCCHNLKVNLLMGGAPRSFNGPVPPLFHFPTAKKHCDRPRAKKGGGVPF
jgi:hypothetical protein